MIVTTRIISKFLSWISLFIGVIFVLAEGNATDAMASVIGGGFLIALGIAGFILNRSHS